MAVNWGLTRERIADKALEHCKALGIGRAATPADRRLALETLDGLLKSLPLYGFEWPQITQGRYILNINAGDQSVTVPADYHSKPSLRFMVDRVKAGFDDEDSTTTLGAETDTGQPFVVADGDIWGRSGGEAYLVSGSSSTRALLLDAARYNGEYGVVLTALSALDEPTLILRARDKDNWLGFGVSAAGVYQILKCVAGVVSAVRTYSTAAASGDIWDVLALGPRLTPIVQRSSSLLELDSYATTAFSEETHMGLRSLGGTSRFKNLRFSEGEEKECDLQAPGQWEAVTNKLELAEYPAGFFVDSGNRIRFAQTPKNFLRAKLLCQRAIADTVAGSNPEVSAMMHLGLAWGVASEIGMTFGVSAVDRQEMAGRWSDIRGRCAGYLAPDGPIEFSVME